MSDKIAVSSRVPVTRQMLSQLDFYRTNLKWNEVILNDPPYPLPDSCHNYGNLDEECIRMIKTKSPEEQQTLLKCRLELLVEENNKQVRLLEEEIGDGTEILNENDDDVREEIPDNIMFAVYNGEVEVVLNWLRAPSDDGDDGADRINFKSSSNGFGNSILNLALYEGHKYFALFLLQKFSPNVDSIDDIGGTPLLHACKGANNNYDQHYSDAVLLLEWGACKNT
jgi:ankyrin repeat protein